jgi:ankyrin repeat protein
MGRFMFRPFIVFNIFFPCFAGTLAGAKSENTKNMPSNGRNSLIEAIRRGDESTAADLMPHFAKNGWLDLQDPHGNTALHIAIRGKHKYTVALLSFYGARTNIRNREGFDPFHVSCTLKDLEMFYFMKSIHEKLNELKKTIAENKSNLTKAVHD